MRPTSILTAVVAAGVLFTTYYSALPAASPPIALPEQTSGLTGAATAAAKSTPAGSATISAQSSVTATATPATATVAATPAATVVSTATAIATAEVTATVAPDSSQPPTTTVAADNAASASAAGEAVIEGTVVANRTPSLVQFFLDGNTYILNPLRSTGIRLVRPTSVLNLYNCDATAGDQQEGCFWDPYLLRQDGFYEIISGDEAGALVSLILREAGAPPANQVWIQNRTGRFEDIYYGTQMRPIAPASVEEFSVDGGGVGVFYLRTCVESGGAPVCEWTAHSAQPGAYYALVSESWSGGPPGSTVSTLGLKPILGSDEPVAAVDTQATEARTVCKLAVPALNVRSGPGLGFEIVKKVRTTGADAPTIIVTGRTEAADWLKVDERIATGGWVIAGSEYLTCDHDPLALPVIQAADLPATPVPTAAPIVEAPVAAAAPESSSPAATLPEAASVEATVPTTGPVETAPAAAGPSIPAGLALLTVQNSFDREMRFTLDQRYRSQLGPSEYDLLSGQSVSLLVYPGVVPFTASSPWQGLSGNDDVHIAADQAKTLYLYFEYDSDEKRWLLKSAE